jgi:thymidylate synthase (FAD)
MQATLIDSMGSDLTVANAARVSFNKKKEAFDVDDARLIGYLAEHKHMSPFGHCFLSFHVQAPVFVARQLVKHKFLRWNEVSRRYVDDRPTLYRTDVWRGRAADKKQGSSDEEVRVHDRPLQHMEEMIDLYEKLLAEGVAPEQARMVLPQATMTEWYWSGSLDAFTDMYNLRAKPDAQKETQGIAYQIGEKIRDRFPVSFLALTKETRE